MQKGKQRFNNLFLVYTIYTLYLLCQTKTKTNKMSTVATEILQQLGGNKFIAMTGSKNLVADGNALQMHLTRNKIGAKFLRIEVTSMDLYTVTFSTSKKVMNAE